MKRALLATGVCLAAAVALRLPAIDQLLDRDTALYAAIGQRIGVDTLPYRDLFDHKQPLVHWVYAAINLIAPGSLGAIRLAAAIPAALAAAFVYLFLDAEEGRLRAAAAAAAGLIAGASTTLQGTDLNTEHLLVMTGTATVICGLWLGRSPRAAVPFAIGLLGGIAVATKAIGGLIALAALIPLLAGRGARRQSILATVAAFGAGLAVPLAAVLGVYALAGGAGDLIFANLTYNSRYVGEQGLTLTPLGPSALQYLTCAALVAGIVRIAARDGRDVVGWTFLAWLVGAWLGAQTSSRGFPHYYVTVVTPCAVLVALSAGRLSRGLRIVHTGALLLAAGAVVALGVPIAQNLSRSGPEIALEVYGPSELALWAPADQVGRLLRARAHAGDRLYVVGSNPQYYWRSELESENRWLFDYPAEVAPERFEPDVAGLCVRGPRFVVVTITPLPAYARRCVDPRRYRPIYAIGPVSALERRP